MLTIQSNIRSFARYWAPRGPVASQVPFALARALTLTVKDAKRNTERRMDRVFDRPTPFTKRGVYIRPATKRRLRARVGIKDAQAKYLAIQEDGGTRRPKRRALVLPAQRRTNRYGNLPRGTVSRMLGRSDHFSAKLGTTAGVWKRLKSGKVRLQVRWGDQAQYRPRFGFEDGAAKTALARFPGHMRRSFARAMETAR